MLFLQVCGMDTQTHLVNILREISNQSKNCYYLWTAPDAVKNLATAVFETWREEN